MTKEKDTKKIDSSPKATNDKKEKKNKTSVEDVKVIDEKKDEVEVEVAVEDSEESKSNVLQSVGRRKRSVARVRVIKNGSGKATINGKDIKEYFGTPLLIDIALGALLSVSQLKKLDVSVKVNGGGKRGQAEAIRLGTARSLLQLNPVFRKNLKKAGYLTRDSRRKERKKPGLKRARKAPQWSKR